MEFSSRVEIGFPPMRIHPHTVSQDRGSGAAAGAGSRPPRVRTSILAPCKAAFRTGTALSRVQSAGHPAASRPRPRQSAKSSAATEKAAETGSTGRASAAQTAKCNPKTIMTVKAAAMPPNTARSRWLRARRRRLRYLRLGRAPDEVEEPQPAQRCRRPFSGADRRTCCHPSACRPSILRQSRSQPQATAVPG
jgi:hypothetical protein